HQVKLVYFLGYYLECSHLPRSLCYISEMQIKTDSHLFGIEESGAEDCTMMPPLTPITVCIH
ncbi:hypothetical protein GBAR_LOCUS22782, partial [Geodia barretti]